MSCFQVFSLLSYMLKYVKFARRSFKFLKISFLKVSCLLINASSRVDLQQWINIQYPEARFTWILAVTWFFDWIFDILLWQTRLRSCFTWSSIFMFGINLSKCQYSLLWWFYNYTSRCYYYFLCEIKMRIFGIWVSLISYFTS